MITLRGRRVPAHRRYWEARHTLLVSTDKRGCFFSLSVLAAVTLYNTSIISRTSLFSNGMLHPALASMFTHMLLEVLLLYYVCRHKGHKAYAKHRNGCIMAARVTSLAVMLHYVPKTWEYTIAAELASGKHMAVAYRLIIGGCLTAGCTIEAFIFQLPIATAIPYHIFRAVLCLVATLPQLLQVFAANPALGAVATSLWDRLSWLYGSAAMATIGTDIPINTSSATCPVLALMLFVHVVFALLVPLYCLGMVESLSKDAFVRQLQASNSSSRRCSSSGSENFAGCVSGDGSMSHNALQAQCTQAGEQSFQQQTHAGTAVMREEHLLVQQGLQDSGLPETGASGVEPVVPEIYYNGSSSRSASQCRHGTLAAAGISLNSTRNGSMSCAAGLDAALQNLMASSSAGGKLLSSEVGLGLHILVMCCTSMLLWALLDVGVAVWADQLTQKLGVCV